MGCLILEQVGEGVIVVKNSLGGAQMVKIYGWGSDAEVGEFWLIENWFGEKWG